MVNICARAPSVAGLGKRCGSRRSVWRIKKVLQGHRQQGECLVESGCNAKYQTAASQYQHNAQCDSYMLVDSYINTPLSLSYGVFYFFFSPRLSELNMRCGSGTRCSSWNVCIQNKDIERPLATGMPINVLNADRSWLKVTHVHPQTMRGSLDQRDQSGELMWKTTRRHYSSALVTIIVGSQDFGSFRGLCISNERLLYLWHPYFCLRS